MSNSKLTRRGLIKTGAVAGAGLATPTLFTSNVWAAAHAGYTNAPQGDTVTWALTFHRLVHTRTRARTSCAHTSWLLST